MDKYIASNVGKNHINLLPVKMSPNGNVFSIQKTGTITGSRIIPGSVPDVDNPSRGELDAPISSVFALPSFAMSAINPGTRLTGKPNTNAPIEKN